MGDSGAVLVPDVKEVGLEERGKRQNEKLTDGEVLLRAEISSSWKEKGKKRRMGVRER